MGIKMNKAGILRAKLPSKITFDDASKYKEGMTPTKIKIWSGSAIDAVQLECGETSFEKHGGNGGGCKEYKIPEGKYIKKICVVCGGFGGESVLTGLTFYDQDGKLLAGKEGDGKTEELIAGDEECICALYGETVKAGGIIVVSGIGIYTAKVPDLKDMFGALGDIKGRFF